MARNGASAALTASTLIWISSGIVIWTLLLDFVERQTLNHTHNNLTNHQNSLENLISWHFLFSLSSLREKYARSPQLPPWKPAQGISCVHFLPAMPAKSETQTSWPIIDGTQVLRVDRHRFGAEAEARGETRSAAAVQLDGGAARPGAHALLLRCRREALDRSRSRVQGAAVAGHRRPTSRTVDTEKPGSRARSSTHFTGFP